ncbi:pyridoxine/pyridoxamine 5'-phosphate oxidase [Georgenia deserti]|uniref:Pyridoxal 5'-phosphate synthase n=1 Tax=Georgenia deserti TaxID=2093781 RepID=A0ABW4KXX0_9MICO
MVEPLRPTLRTLPSLTGRSPVPDLAALPADPMRMFRDWLDLAIASAVPEPHTMTLSTVDDDGVPDARVLILKEVDETGWAFASTAESRKGRQLAARPAAALSFWWQPLARAVRVRGPVVEATRAESEEDLQARSPTAQAEVAGETWTLWRVRPTRVEFWRGSPDRRHLRIVYRRDGESWRASVS